MSAWFWDSNISTCFTKQWCSCTNTWLYYYVLLLIVCYSHKVPLLWCILTPNNSTCGLYSGNLLVISSWMILRMVLRNEQQLIPLWILMYPWNSKPHLLILLQFIQPHPPCLCSHNWFKTRLQKQLNRGRHNCTDNCLVK